MSPHSVFYICRGRSDISEICQKLQCKMLMVHVEMVALVRELLSKFMIP